MPGNKTRAFAVLWGGQLLSLAGSSAASFALGLTVYAETGSTAALALITAVSTLGSIYLAPVCGAVADHMSRRTAALVGNLGAGAVALLLAWVAALGAGRHLPVVLCLVLAGSLLAAMLSVTLAASVRELRGEADLTRVNGITSFLEGIPTFSGPLLGALVHSQFTPSLVFLLDGLTFFACAAAVAAVRWQGRPRATGRPLRPFAGAAGGVRRILADPGFRQLQLTFAGVNFLNGLSVASATAFVVAASSAGAASWNLAAVGVAAAAGLLLGSTVVVVLARRVPRQGLIGGAVMGAGLLGRIGLAATTAPVVWFAASAARSACAQVANAPLTAIWQERVPSDIQATVFGARRLLGQGPYPLAVLLGGVLADAVGSAGLMVFTGVGELLLGAFLLASSRVRELSRSARGPELVGG
ncbi:MFS transporter [Allokutzneria oryzae]|uniref:MFS transporter n=1 Tax=Allokutzneria oryzae TaxID=1378989 RepID=A0ABV6A8E1_9PSEU